MDSISKREKLAYIVIILLVFVIISSAYREKITNEHHVTSHLTKQTNEALFSIKRLCHNLRNPNWDDSNFREKCYSTLESFYYEVNEAYKNACKNKEYISETVFDTEIKLHIIACHIWDTYGSSFDELKSGNADTVRQKAMLLENEISEANFTGFLVDYSGLEEDSWHILNKELTNYIGRNMNNLK